MDRLTQLRGEAGAGGSRDTSLDSTAPSEAYITASDSKYFSLTEDDTSFDISSIKDVSLASTADPDKSGADTDDLIENLSPTQKKKDLLDSYKIGKQIDAANILSGGVQIFDDNDNSYDGNELIIDEMDNKSGLPEAAEPTDTEAVANKDPEVVLQIDGKNVNAIDIGNGLYLYRKEGEEELAAVQIIDDDHQQPSFKFLKVRENAEGNLEVYEEIEIEVPKDAPAKEGKVAEKNKSHVPIKDISKVISDPTTSKVDEKQKPVVTLTDKPPSATAETIPEKVKDNQSQTTDTKNDTNFNGKLVKLNETRKSPVIHSTPNKEGIPLTKTMVDLQLHPNRQMDKVKTIELHTDSAKTKIDSQLKSKDLDEKPSEAGSIYKEELMANKPIDNATEVKKSNTKKSDLKALEVQDEEKKPETSSAKPLEDTKIEPLKAESETSSKINEGIHKEINEQQNLINSVKVQKQNVAKDIDTSNGDKTETRTDAVISEPPKSNEVKTDADAIMKSELVNLVETDKDANITAKVAEDTSKKLESNKEKDCLVTESANEGDKVIEKEDKDKLDNKLSIKEAPQLKAVDKLNIDSKLSLDKTGLECHKIDEAGSSGKEVAQKTDSIHSKNVSKDNETGTINVVDKKNNPPTTSENDVVPKNNLIDSKTIELVCKEENRQLDKVICETSSTKEEVIKEVPSTNQNISNLSMNLNKNENIVHINKNEVKPSIQINLLQDVTRDKTVAKFNLEDKSTLQTDLTIVKPTSNAKSSKIEVDPSVRKVTPAKQETPQPTQILKPEESQNMTTSKLTESVKKEVTNFEKVTTAPKLDIEKIASTFILNFDQKVNKSNLQLPKNVTITSKTNEVTKSNVSECNSQITTALKNEMSVKGLMDAAIKDSLQQPQLQFAKKPIELEKIQQRNITDLKSALKKENPMANLTVDPVNNNHAPVPFGKWTEANRQAFLNKIKESKVPTTTSNTKSLKQANDLNNRDFLLKIDSQRQSSNAKVQELAALNKFKVRNETKPAFSSNVPQTTTTSVKPNQEPKMAVKSEAIALKNQSVNPAHNKLMKSETATKQEAANILKNLPNTTFSSSTSTKKIMTQPPQRKGMNNQDLIDKTIEGIINRALPAKPQEEPIAPTKVDTKSKPATYKLNIQPKKKQNTLDAIEMKMNELHGIPFVERPPHELPRVYNLDVKTYSKEPKSKVSMVPNLLPYAKSQPAVSKDIVEIDSEEEIIEHIPVTGDIELNKKELQKIVASKLPAAETIQSDNSKKESIITEKDFDKFARRNSFTYDNCLTVNFESNPQHHMLQPVKDKDIPIKKYSRNEQLLADAKNVRTQKQFHQASSKLQMTSKLMPVSDETLNKNYQSKLQMAYQSALTAKKLMESPITIIEDKPVKVVFLDSNPEVAPNLLNVQGPQLAQTTKISPAKSPTKKQPEQDALNTNDSVDSDMLEVIPDGKSHDENKTKSKHQRKQVLTPVETPDLELISADDLNISVESSPKKKRKTEDFKVEKSPKNVLPKKTYLLGRNTVSENDEMSAEDAPLQSLVNAATSQTSLAVNAASAIDNLVKAAELLESQSDLNASTASVDSGTQQTPVKRGRGRPRKYPLPEGSPAKPEVSSPQKKPRLIDAKKSKKPVTSDDDSSDDEFLIRENWTMGKINENIVCPICSKLFRSENVVFKHVKHCTGPSPNRSDSDKRSSRRLSKISQDSESKSSQDSFSEEKEVEKIIPSKVTARLRKSKESVQSVQKDDIIVIEDSPIVQKPERSDRKQHVSRNQQVKPKIQPKTSSLACETCGKAFRQLSYLVSHRLQHKKETNKKPLTEPQVDKSVFSCEVCKKEFRKLHHLVNHRLIHNPSTVLTKAARKSSAEYNDSKNLKEQESNQFPDESAAFRCEPCDKSFRKLYHLVEHRETHDGINRQKINAAPAATEDKPATDPPQCDICKKTFRKLYHLIEHKEQHVDAASEKSDDKSVKSSLSTRDIIHECSLCYMVFPNEHSLTKHSVICQRKKKQSASKQVKQTADDAVEIAEDKTCEFTEPEVEKVPVEQKEVSSESVNPAPTTVNASIPAEPTVETPKEVAKVSEKRPSKESEPKTPKEKPNNKRESTQTNTKATEPEVPAKIKKVEEKPKPTEIIEIEDTPKKKTPTKEKIAPSVTKRKKSGNLPPPRTEITDAVESSDDDEVRYMLNPNYQETANESKVFMKVRAQKRNSLQIERPNSKDLVKRRTSLQHPPKIPRLKKVDEAVPIKQTKTVAKAWNAVTKNVVKTIEPVSSCDSDDSDVKYSFPKTVEKTPPVQEVKKEVPTPKEKKKGVILKRKSLTGLAKRKTMGTILAAKKSPEKPIKRRAAPAEHRCDCGALFGSAALLSRHTSVAHTPPRIRRRRSPPPSPPPDPPKPSRKSLTDIPKTNKKNANTKSDKTIPKSAAKTPRKSIKEETKPKTTTGKINRNTAHRGVPVPEKMKRLFAKMNKDDL